MPYGFAERVFAMHRISRFGLRGPVFILLLIILLSSAVFSSCQISTEPSSAPEGCKKAANEAVDFAFYYKDTWTLDRTDGMLSVKYNVGNSLSQQYATISAQAFNLADTSQGANDYWDRYKTELQAAYGTLVSFQNEKLETKLGGVIANRNRYTIVMSDVSYLFDQVLCVRYGNVYIVTLCAPESNYQSVVDGFDTVVSSFRFTS